MKNSDLYRSNRTATVLSLALLALLPGFALAQLPTPTYGWNLGNTLEPPGGEGTWGPAATQNLINAVADAGFNTIRLPVAWDSHANQSTHLIDPAWMARVKQVVDWCYAKNLRVIINCHWDGGWLENNITDTVNPTINAKMQSYWTQIATAFAGYDDRLLFAGANEPNCGTAAQWATLRSYYNTFISAVRATGGNNASRWLVIQGPDTNIDKTYDWVSVLPTDSATGKLMVEVHFYPFQWTIMTKDESWGKMFYFWGQGYHSPTMLDRNSTWGEEAYVDEQFQKMATKFVNQGVPVIVGEWGAVKRTGYPDLTGTELNRHLASRTYFAKTITDKANALGLKPIWWDAGGTGSNTMWLFDRTTAVMIDPDTINALTGGPALAPPGSSSLPNAPGGLAAAAASSSQVNVTWADNAANEDGFELDRATNSTFTSGLVTATLAANTTSRTVSGLTAATTYYFRVRAVNNAGASPYSSTASVMTSNASPPPPTGGTSSSAGGNTGGGGGGGAPSAWFVGTLLLAATMRRGFCRQRGRGCPGSTSGTGRG
ncbi:MAG TPA: cellulase family glycosylhydrolase [Lacunisphaera sp.]|nr:cellulase family glycosylhydrolase [Lacunisphaera sp.]